MILRRLAVIDEARAGFANLDPGTSEVFPESLVVLYEATELEL